MRKRKRKSYQGVMMIIILNQCKFNSKRIVHSKKETEIAEVVAVTARIIVIISL